MSEILDLFGEQVPRNRGGRGRPSHIATRENVSRVKELVSSGVLHEEIARQMHVTLPTLRRHYFHVIHIRRRKKKRA